MGNTGDKKSREARKPDSIQMGEGLMPMPRRLVEKIQAGEFVEFAEFPVVEGGSRSIDLAEQDMGDKVVVLQAPEQRRNRKEVPDASLWGSCFTLYERAVLMGEPDRGPELSAYREQIQKAARSYQWELVIKYDKQFRKAAAVDRRKCWARVDASLFMQELAGPQATQLAMGARGPRGPLENSSTRKRARGDYSGGHDGTGRKGAGGACHIWNWQDGHCPYGGRCKFAHMCAKCGGPHPGARCGGSQLDGQDGWSRGLRTGHGPGPL